jgi:acetyl-CoA carboxylase biotin carboxyl carrier protein
MDALKIKAFIDAMAASDLAEMEASHDGWTLRLVRRPGAVAPDAPPVAPRVPTAPSTPKAPRAPASTPTARPRELLAPLFGVLHLQPSPGAVPFVGEGQAVHAGQTLCVIEAMKVFNEVQAERDGVVDVVLVTSGVEVDAGQPLMRFR